MAVAFSSLVLTSYHSPPRSVRDIQYFALVKELGNGQTSFSPSPSHSAFACSFAIGVIKEVKELLARLLPHQKERGGRWGGREGEKKLDKSP